jgi:hypothetical protein
LKAIVQSLPERGGIAAFEGVHDRLDGSRRLGNDDAAIGVRGADPSIGAKHDEVKWMRHRERGDLLASAHATRGREAVGEEGDIAADRGGERGEAFARQIEVPQSIKPNQGRGGITGSAGQTGFRGDRLLESHAGAASDPGRRTKREGGSNHKVLGATRQARVVAL